MEYTRIITDEEAQILHNDLLDIKAWIDGAIDGKIANCRKRAAKQYEELAKAEDLDMIPTKEHLKVAALFAHPTYKNRVQTEEAVSLGRLQDGVKESQIDAQLPS